MAKWQFKKSEIPCLLSQLYRFIGFFIYKETETAVIFITSSIHGTLGCSLGHGLLHVLCMCLDWVESRYPSNSAPLSLLGLCGLCGRVEAVKRRALGQFSVQGSVLKFSLAFTRPPRMNFPQHKRQKKNLLIFHPSIHGTNMRPCIFRPLLSTSVCTTSLSFPGSSRVRL